MPVMCVMLGGGIVAKWSCGACGYVRLGEVWGLVFCGVWVFCGAGCRYRAGCIYIGLGKGIGLGGNVRLGRGVELHDVWGLGGGVEQGWVL